MENRKVSKHNSNCFRYNENGLVYARIEGRPYERGRIYGELLADEIAEAITSMRDLVYLQTGLSWEFFRDEAEVVQTWITQLNDSQLPYGEYLQELEGMTAGVKESRPDFEIELEDLIVWNGYEEMTDYWFPKSAAEIYQNINCGDIKGNTYKEFNLGANDHCSGFIATGSYTGDGQIVMAHNSFTPFESGNFMNIVVSVYPEKGNAFIMQSEPGYIHSMTDYYESKFKDGKGGLMVTETTIGGFNAYDSKGIPEWLRIRYAVQYAGSLDRFVELFWTGNNGGYANTWLVGDIATNEIMRFEAGLKFYKVDKTTDGYFVGFNAPLDPRIRNFETSNSGFADIRRHQGSRQVRLPQLMEQYRGKLNAETAKIIIADHYDVYIDKENPSSRTVCSHYELDDRSNMSQTGRPVPYQPRGAVDGFVSTAVNAKELKLWGRWGSSCGTAFAAADFLKKHPQFDYLEPFLKDRPSQPWTLLPKV